VDFVAYCVEVSRSLDIVLRPWAPKVPETEQLPLPSWIRSSSFSQFAQDFNGRLHRVNGATFVGSSAIYSASGTTQPDASITVKQAEIGSMKAELAVTGIIVDSVNVVGQLSTDGSVPQD
jgi:hypothetical protein